MIAILGKQRPPDEALAHKALAAVPYPVPDVALRRVGECLIGVATRPGYVTEWLSSDGPFVAALAGALENASELHKVLTDAGRAPRSTSPADIVAAAFSVWGTDAPKRMRGPCAAIVTDGRSVWAWRDHVGFRPLFYRDDRHAFVVAGEARQVAVAAQLTEQPDVDVLEGLLFGDMPSDMPAALKGVSRLAQAALVTGHAEKGISLHVYWTPIDLVDTVTISASDAHEKFRELLKQASVRSLAGDDAMLLSGGLDSPAVAAYAAPEYFRRTGRRMGAVSAVFPDLPAVDEKVYIDIVAERFGMELHTYRPKARALDDVDEWCRRFGTPIPILSIPEVWDAYRIAREHGYANVSTGEFAEFAYGSFKHAVPHLLTRGRMATLAKLLRSEYRRGSSLRNLSIQLAGTFVPGAFANWYKHVRGHELTETVPAWIDKRRKDRALLRTDLLPPGRERWRTMQIGGTWGATVMAEADSVVATMAGVTIHRPFADIDLWEFFLSLPVEIKFPEFRYKAMALRALRGVVPDEIVGRKYKTAFDSHMMTQVDYATLARLLLAPRVRIPGVDYALLAQRIEQRDFTRFDWYWAKDLAWIHAFLNAW